VKRGFCLGCLLIFAIHDSARAAPMDELVAAAQKEGVIELLAPSSTGQAGVQALGNALSKLFRRLFEAGLRNCTAKSILSLTKDRSRPSLEDCLLHYL
jgi:hypothetical protein